MFIQIGRIGRSLGVHLLLASQRLEEGRLRGLETYLSYRIGLRTFSAAESRAALGVPDAYHLPNVPGSGYPEVRHGRDGALQGGVRLRGRTARARQAGAVRRAAAGRPPARAVHRGPGAGALRAADGPDPAVPDAPDGRGRRARRHRARRDRAPAGGRRAPPAHQVWLPPLDSPPSLDELLPGLAAVRGPRAAPSPGYEGAGRLVVPLGLVDKPFEQRRDALYRDFSGAAGHMQIVGRPAVRQVDAAAHADRGVRPHPHPARSAVLRPRLRRRRHVVGRRPAARRRGRLPAGPGAGAPYGRRGVRHPDAPRGVLPRARHRLHRHLPAGCGRAARSR